MNINKKMGKICRQNVDRLMCMTKNIFLGTLDA